MDPRYAPPIAIVALVLFVVMVMVFVRLVRPKREPGEPEPRPRIPTEPDLDDLRPSLPPAGQSFPLDPDMQPSPALELPPVTERIQPACKACRGPLAEDGVALEAWERVNDFWERAAGDGWIRDVFRFLGLVRKRQHGRELDQGLAGYCRSCAIIAQPIRRAYREKQAARNAAEDRQFEREGLPDEVRDVINRESERYASERPQRARRGWRAE